jgi:hypothetical protein
MDTNIVLEYINYIKKSLEEFYRILLEDDYQAKFIHPIIDKYIDIRYYNNTNSKERDNIKLIDNELKPIINSLLKEYPKDQELIKNIYALVSYILYFDDVSSYSSLNNLVATLINDEVITISYDEEKVSKLTDFIKEFNLKKEEFINLFDTSLFSLTEKRLKKHLYYINLTNTIKVPKIYSDYAINKAFNTGNVNEDKYYILYTLVAYNILKSAIDLDFSRQYLLDIPITIFDKPKKIERLLRILDNDLVKSHINFKISYNTYISNKEIINSFIKKGYHIAIELDDSFANNLDELFIFSYVLVYDYLDCYDMIKDSKKDIKGKLITL